MCHHFLSYFHILCMLDWGVGPWTRIRTCEKSLIVKKKRRQIGIFYVLEEKIPPQHLVHRADCVGKESPLLDSNSLNPKLCHQDR